MIKIRKILFLLLIFILWFWIAIATNNFFKEWENWDANVDHLINPANDNFILSWRVDIEDSNSINYLSWYRWNIVWTIVSDLFGIFNIINKLELNFKTDIVSSYYCWSWDDPLEIYSISWEIESDNWWIMSINETDSYFCSNQYTYIEFTSDSLGLKEIWETQNILVDVFDKQQIYVSGIVKLIWDEDGILSRIDNPIYDIDTDIKNYYRLLINKNIKYITKSLDAKTWYLIENDFVANLWKEELYYYDYTWETETLSFSWSDYINKWKILTIWLSTDDKISVSGINTVIVKWWNIYIEDNLYNENDDDSLLVLVAKRDIVTWNGWNIYISPAVTNIDAVLVADWSLLSMALGEIKNVQNDLNVLRRQLLIYWSVFSSNSVWTDVIPYWSDYYENSWYLNNEMPISIYDLWNLRTFNLNYWDFGKLCNDELKLAPIDWYWDFLQNAWAGDKVCYNDDIKDVNLRWSDRINPLIVKYNSNINLLEPLLLRTD